jgi:hypothetical protein
VGIAAQTRHQLAREIIDGLTVIDAKIRAADNPPATRNAIPVSDG